MTSANGSFLGGPEVKTASFPESTTISHIAYDTVLSALDITFRNGRKYRYQNVDEKVVEGLIKAESAGKYFASNIRKLYAYAEVSKEQKSE